MNLDHLTELVIRRMHDAGLIALLIGEKPQVPLPFCFAVQEPYDAVFLGLLSPAELLRMPDDTVCQALLDEKPVWIYADQPFMSYRSAGVLRRELKEHMQRLVRLGVCIYPSTGQWITADAAARIPVDWRLQSEKITPLAREMMEERRHGSRYGDRKFLGNKEV